MVLIVTVVAISLSGESVAALFSYQRTLILHGEVWRLLSGHLAHLGFLHLLFNIAGLILVWFLVGKGFVFREWVLLILVLAGSTSLCLLLFAAELESYVGLSGVLHGMLLAGALAQIERAESKILAAAVVIKLILEQVIGPMPGHDEFIGGRVIVDAHLYGALTGVCFVVGRRVYSAKRAKRDGFI